MLRRSIVAGVIACGSVAIVASAQGQTVPVAPPAAVAQDSAIPLAPVTVAAKKARSLAGLDPQTRRRRLYAFLARRGFSVDDINRVVSRDAEAQEDD